MRYQVRFVADGSLPGGLEWAFARTIGETYLFVTQSAIDVTTGRCDALTHAWSAWQAAEAQSISRGLRSLAAASSA